MISRGKLALVIAAIAAAAFFAARDWRAPADESAFTGATAVAPPRRKRPRGTLPNRAPGATERRARKMVQHQIESPGWSRDAYRIPRSSARCGKSPPRIRPRDLRKQAYDDTPLPIGHGQTISQPYIVAAMTGLLRLAPGMKVLEIGTGSGYQAAVLAHLTQRVYTIEIIEPLAKNAAETLEEEATRTSACAAATATSMAGGGSVRRNHRDLRGRSPAHPLWDQLRPGEESSSHRGNLLGPASRRRRKDARRQAKDQLRHGCPFRSMTGRAEKE